MSENTPDRREVGFKERTRLAAARDRLLSVVSPVDETDSVALTAARGRALAASVTADRDVPHYDRVAMDGYAVRASDTFGAGDRSPAVLRIDDQRVEPGRAVRVHTGSERPPGADAVVPVEYVERVGDEIEVFDAVAEGENVAPVGEDVTAGEDLYDPGTELGPADLGLLRSVGVETVRVRERPRVAVLPTGGELVAVDPTSDEGSAAVDGEESIVDDLVPGEVVETNGLTVAEYVRRWGGDPTHRAPVDDDREAIRETLRAHADHDILVTTGGSSVGERDLVPDVVADSGELLVHGVAQKPGHPVAAGVVEEVPVVVLPGSPVACIVAAVQLLRPALKAAADLPVGDHPTTPARLDRKLSSEPGIRTFARVRLTTRDGQRVAVPTRTSGASVLSSAALADGWVEVEEDREGLPEGDLVAVQDWEWCP